MDETEEVKPSAVASTAVILVSKVDCSAPLSLFSVEVTRVARPFAVNNADAALVLAVSALELAD